MSLKFLEKNDLIIGADEWTLAPFQFSKMLKIGGAEPSWQDIIVSGTGSVTLVNAKADGLNYVKLFGACEQRNLPEGYTEVEYLESSGTQYINTGIKVKATQTVKAIMALPSESQTGWMGCISAVNNLIRFGTTNGLIYCQRPTTGGMNISADTDFHTFIASPTEIAIDNTSQSINVTEDLTANFCVFAQNDDRTGEISSYLKGKVKRNEIIESNGVLVQCLIPAKRNSDNVLGMYDTVTGTFFTNAGTGTFNAGADVTTPTPDRPIDIVSNNGTLTPVPVKGYDSTKFTAVGSPTITADGIFTTTNVENDNFITFSNFTATNDLKFEMEFTMDGGFYESFFVNIDWPNLYSGMYMGEFGITWALFGAENLGWQGYIQDGHSYKLYLEWKLDGTTELGIKKDSEDAYRTSNGTWSGSLPTLFAIGGRYSNSGNAVIDLKKIRCISNGVEVFSGTKIVSYNITTTGTQETVEVFGKNLYNSETMTPNAYITATGQEAPSLSAAALNHTDFIKVQAGVYYTISVSNRAGVGTQNTGAFNWFSSNDLSTILATRNTYDIGSNNDSYTSTNEAPVGAEYLIINFVDGEEVQIEQGSTATTYEPYYYGGSVLAEMLLAISTYKDEQNVTTGGITRNVGIKVLDGTESWSTYSVTQGILFRTQIAESVSDSKLTLGVLCNAYRVVEVGNRTSGTLSGTSKNYDFLNDNYSTLEQWIEYIKGEYNAGFPVIIVYPLAEPTTDTVTAQTLTTKAGSNTIEITQASINNLPLEVSYKGIV